jgi:hypothetical protein
MIPINLGILIFAPVYEFILVVDAIHNKNNVLLFSICIFNICRFVYSVMQYISVEDTTTGLFDNRYGTPTLIDTTRNLWPQIQPAENLVAVITALGSILVCLFAYLLHREYSWVIYKSVQGSSKPRRRYLFYEVPSTTYGFTGR